MIAKASAIDIAAAAMTTHTMMFVDVDTQICRGIWLREPISNGRKRSLEIISNHDGTRFF